MRRPLPARLLALVLATTLLAACGGAYYEPVPGPVGPIGPPPPPPPPPIPYGSVDFDNLSPEYMLGFYMALAPDGPFTGNLLGAPLPPGFVQWVGDFPEDVYDAEADAEFGDLIQWFDVFVPGNRVTVFEVY